MSNSRWRESKNDRLFLEALHYFTLHNICWRALPEQFGNWNSIWKRFDPLGKAGVFEDDFSILAGLDESAHLIAMFDSTVIRAHVSAACAKGGRKIKRLGVRAEGSEPKSIKTDRNGQPLGFELTGGEVSDSKQFESLMETGPQIRHRAIIADKGYDSDVNREIARKAGAIPVIPYRSNRQNIPKHFATALYRGRARIEQMMGKLKRFKRVALRCEITARNFRSIVAIACFRGTSDLFIEGDLF
ncbi:IS5 family transposase [Brucella pituitosa]|uniref:IS5 family transposase n=1 Tax=Brucella pituitosa TaxID=571256 RepID=UPI000CFEFA56|nr:hypothetical protein CQ062_17780 [Ochrobactrum sp. MYb68]